MTNALAPVVHRRPPPLVPRRLLGYAVLAVVVAWAIVQGAHSHDTLQPVAADLSGVEVSRVIHVDASTGQLDLEDVAVAPGEVVEFVLDGSGGSGHRFVLAGLTGAAIQERTAPNGDVIVRVQAPQDGSLSFFCEIPGHEGLHGSLVVGVGD
ncbi:MAG: hypothetical protein OXC71_08790 [Chloroflexi bacterium]|nr:hypothetical protein [Chloroflexota bacterium]